MANDKKHELVCSVCKRTFLGNARQLHRSRPMCQECWKKPHAEWRTIELECFVCGEKFLPSKYKLKRHKDGFGVPCGMVCARKASNSTREENKRKKQQKLQDNLPKLLNLGCPWSEGRVTRYERQVAIF